MLSLETLDLLRQWWKARPSHYDAEAPIAEAGCSGQPARKPMTTRQLSRLLHQAADGHIARCEDCANTVTETIAL